MSQNTIPANQTSFATIPQRYQRILDLLDGHANGKVSYEETKAISEEDLRIAKHLRQQQTNAWVDKHFPEVDAFDQF